MMSVTATPALQGSGVSVELRSALGRVILMKPPTASAMISYPGSVAYGPIGAYPKSVRYTLHQISVSVPLRPQGYRLVSNRSVEDSARKTLRSPRRTSSCAQS